MREVREGPPTSAEVRVLQKFAVALDMFEALPSVTARLGWSESARRPDADPADCRDLSGTWWGVTETAWHLKSEGDGAGTFESAMGVSVRADQGLDLVWFYPVGFEPVAGVTL